MRSPMPSSTRRSASAPLHGASTASRRCRCRSKSEATLRERWIGRSFPVSAAKESRSPAIAAAIDSHPRLARRWPRRSQRHRARHGRRAGISPAASMIWRAPFRPARPGPMARSLRRSATRPCRAPSARRLGRNPWPIVVPCHRVLAANGKTGGFSADGGVDTKMRMLTIERRGNECRAVALRRPAACGEAAALASACLDRAPVTG